MKPITKYMTERHECSNPNCKSKNLIVLFETTKYYPGFKFCLDCMTTQTFDIAKVVMS
jgi:hypothetical protein